MQQQWIERDRRVNWHPYSQMKTTTHLPVVKAKDEYLFTADGQSYIDAISSWWVTLHGHAHPYIAGKVSQQLMQLEQVIFAGFTHPPAIELAEQLLALLPASQQKVFYTDNGSTAVEVAIKMCVQLHHQQGYKKTKILAFRNGYHGDTFGAMSVSSRGTWTAPFADLLFDVLFIDPPSPDNIDQLKLFIDEHADDLACFIYEPLVQGAGGMRMHDAVHLSQLMQYCRIKNILMIQDEIFVGFGRTGKNFAADHLTAEPDLMCFSKGLTGGTMPLGITTCSNHIYDSFYADEKAKALFHGHSFTANPVACSAALASLELLQQPFTQQKIREISDQHALFVKRIQREFPGTAIRQCGTIVALEVPTGRANSYFDEQQPFLYKYFLDRNILLRPLGNTLYLVPPYCISIKNLEMIYRVITEVLTARCVRDE